MIFQSRIPGTAYGVFCIRATNNNIHTFIEQLRPPETTGKRWCGMYLLMLTIDLTKEAFRGHQSPIGAVKLSDRTLQASGCSLHDSSAQETIPLQNNIGSSFSIIRGTSRPLLTAVGSNLFCSRKLFSFAIGSSSHLLLIGALPFPRINTKRIFSYIIERTITIFIGLLIRKKVLHFLCRKMRMLFVRLILL